MINQLTRPVGAGEAEAIALAVQLNADVLLIDERRARKVALELGLPVTGILGVLLEAKSRGLIAAVKPILDQMEATVAFRAEAVAVRCNTSRCGRVMAEASASGDHPLGDPALYAAGLAPPTPPPWPPSATISPQSWPKPTRPGIG